MILRFKPKFFRFALQLLFCLSLISCKPYNCSAQNLVPNPSFEDHIGCPDNLFEMWRVPDWFPVNGSPDYYNDCATWSGASIPSNFAGYQQPYRSSDHGYLGIASIPLSDTVRESFGIELTSTLQIGQSYYVSFVYSAG